MSLCAGLAVGCATDRGAEREQNEDTYRVPDALCPGDLLAYALPDAAAVARVGALFVVADGLGGHAAGERASAEACDAFVAAYYEAAREDETDADRMRRAMVAADGRVLRCAGADPTLAGMGTTLTAVALRGEELIVGHVGDSRAYLLREGIEQLTEDHTRAAEYFRMGRLTEAQMRRAKDSPLTQAVGVGVDLDVQVRHERLLVGDRILLCSDGLYGMIREPEEIAGIVAKAGTLQAACDALVQEANVRGGEDNITVVLIGVSAEGR